MRQCRPIPLIACRALLSGTPWTGRTMEDPEVLVQAISEVVSAAQNNTALR